MLFFMICFLIVLMTIISFIEVIILNNKVNYLNELNDNIIDILYSNSSEVNEEE